MHNNYSINGSLMPQREEKYSCRKGRKILCQAERKAQMIHLSKYLACFHEWRKAAPPEECLAALQQCKGALQILKGFLPAQDNSTIQFTTKTQEESAQSTSLAGKAASGSVLRMWLLATSSAKRVSSKS